MQSLQTKQTFQIASNCGKQQNHRGENAGHCKLTAPSCSLELHCTPLEQTSGGHMATKSNGEEEGHIATSSHANPEPSWTQNGCSISRTSSHLLGLQQCFQKLCCRLSCCRLSWCMLSASHQSGDEDHGFCSCLPSLLHPLNRFQAREMP